MQGGRDPFGGFGDPFGGFGDPFGGFGRQRSMISEFFGGRDPFDDPFFRSPFGGMFQSSPFGGMFQSSPFGSNGGPFMNSHTSGFLQHPPPSLPQQPNLSRGPVMSRGPVIEELNSDDEEDEKESGEMKRENPRKHGRSSKEPIVEDPDDEATEKKSKHLAHWNDMNQMQHGRMQPGVNSFTFQSSSVSYGGANGAFYTTSSTRRTGSDGLTYEEFKEADSSTRQATHRVGRAIHNKGHSVTRKLKSDGHVDTMQTHLLVEMLCGLQESVIEGAGHFLALGVRIMQEAQKQLLKDSLSIQEEQNLMLVMDQAPHHVLERTELAVVIKTTRTINLSGPVSHTDGIDGGFWVLRVASYVVIYV